MSEIQPFKANPIPYKSQVKGLWKEMCEVEDKERIMRINQRKQEIFELAKLPPRMEMQRNLNKSTQKTVNKQEVVPYKAKEVPDFKRLQETFAKTLEDKKREKAPPNQLSLNFMN